MTAVFNFVLAGSVSGDADSGDLTAANYFSTYRTERTTTRNEELLQLDSILASTESGSQTYQDAIALKMQIVEMMEKKVSEGKLDGEIVLVGSFCAGKCNRIGVTVTVDDDVYTGITKENFEKFWTENVMSRLAAQR